MNQGNFIRVSSPSQRCGEPFGYPQQLQQQQLPYQIPYRGVPLTSPESLNFSVANRKGAFMHSSSLSSGYSTSDEGASLKTQEHIQRRPYSRIDQHQDLEGLDVIRVQATRISNLLDRIEIMEREISKQTERDSEYDKDLLFWEKQHHILDVNRLEALRTIEALTETEINEAMGKYNQDKNEVERNITMKLREIEEANQEIAYYKSICIPNEEEALEVKRLQDNETRLLSSNATLNKELLVVAHEQRNQE